uniref:BPL/LPL catalytic domain-containing protein n=1 Tax=Attheya septentrionalis TaxID=420275 RepID=A0A7S2U6B7_9STRA|mmetsp:Transcript_12331/g.22381  ORF Transcript_12331/g.22381 Transcript_12331/m.22381 type:complete len:358 (+) Transcript_12331:198-1271(+)
MRCTNRRTSAAAAYYALTTLVSSTATTAAASFTTLPVRRQLSERRSYGNTLEVPVSLLTTTHSLPKGRKRPSSVALFSSSSSLGKEAGASVVDSMVIHSIVETESTQDEARRLIMDELSSAHDNFAVLATEQTRGRGTCGRSWIGRKGNVFLTVGIKSEEVPIHPITLVPLKMGVLVARAIHDRIQNSGNSSSGKGTCAVTVKWPNDVLVDGKKVAGILIENFIHDNQVWFLVGIGINVAEAPAIDSQGPEGGRPSACILDYCGSSATINATEECNALATQIANSVHTWVQNSTGQYETSRDVVKEWEEWAELGKELFLRDDASREPVIPLGIEPDGRLRVRDRNGRERFLVADYLY